MQEVLLIYISGPVRRTHTHTQHKLRTRMHVVTGGLNRSIYGGVMGDLLEIFFLYRCQVLVPARATHILRRTHALFQYTVTYAQI